MVVTWGDFATAAPDIATKGRELLCRTGHGAALLVAVRGDDPPRVHPISVGVVDGGLYAFILPSPKLQDLEHDGQFTWDGDDSGFSAARADGTRRCGRLWSTYETVEIRTMAKTNLTLQLDEDVIRRARIVAAKRGTSVSALVARELDALVEQDARYEEAWRRAEDLMRGAAPHGGRSWRRDELHDR